MKQFFTFYFPPILWSSFIFIASSNSDPLGPLPESAIPAMKATRILGVRLDNLIWALSHIFIYAVLSFLVARALNQHRYFNAQFFQLVFALSLLYGISDEIHQHFVPGRGFQLYDILMDGLGALVGLGLYAALQRKRAQKQRQQALLL